MSDSKELTSVEFFFEDLKLAVKIGEVKHSIEKIWRCCGHSGYEFTFEIKKVVLKLIDGESTSVFVVETKEKIYILEFTCRKLLSELFMSLPVFEYTKKKMIIETEKPVEHICVHGY